MNKFKVGDRVVANNQCRNPEVIGLHGRVLEDSVAPWVEFDREFLGAIKYFALNGAHRRCTVLAQDELDPEPVSEPAPAGNIERCVPSSHVSVYEPLTRTAAVIDAATAYREAYQRVQSARQAVSDAENEVRQALDAMRDASDALLERARGEAA